MTHPLQRSRLRSHLTALSLAVLVGSGLSVPLASPASATVAKDAVLVPSSSADQNLAAALPSESVLKTGTEWRYLDTNRDPAAENPDRNVWTKPGFDDSSWANAPSGFGVKRNELAAVGPLLPATQLKHYIDGDPKNTVPTYFFRTTFELESGASQLIDEVSASIVHDDAARVYVNGEMAAGFLDARVDDTAPSNLQYAGEGQSTPVTSDFTVRPELFRDGTNTIAVAIYQDRAGSSDAYFDFPVLAFSSETPVEAAPETPGAAVPAPTRVILTPTESPSTSQSFSWLAGDETQKTGEVEIVASSGGAPQRVAAKPVGQTSGNSKEHFSATVSNLMANTEYQYRVGAPGAMSSWYRFTTASAQATEFQFVYYGDAQVGLDTTWPSVVAQAEAKAPHSIGSVHAGDLINTSSNDTEWLNWFKGMAQSAATSNVMAAPGNHEYKGDSVLTAWKAHFEYPLNQPSNETIGELAKRAEGDTDAARQYAAYFAHWADFAAETVYYTDYQGVRFITLNATRDQGFLTPPNLPSCTGAECPSGTVRALWPEYQAAWLDFVLKNSPSKWNVVTFHQPVYSASQGRNDEVLRNVWVPVFERNNIDLVLMGHDHAYARGFNNDDATSAAGVTSGPVYTVANSGAKHYDLETEEKNVWTNNGATQVIRAENVTTYQVIDVSENALTYRSYVAETAPDAKSFKLQDSSGARPVYVSAEVPAVGELFDEFTVTKYSTGEKWVTEAGVTAPKPPTITTGASAVRQGETVDVSGSGFTPEAEIELELHSTPAPLGSVRVNAEGSFATTVTVPLNTQAGADHSILAVLPNGTTVSTPITVLTAEPTEETPDPNAGSPIDKEPGAGDGPSPSGTDTKSEGNKTEALATTGGYSAIPFAFAGIVLVLLGAGATIWRRGSLNRSATSESQS